MSPSESRNPGKWFFCIFNFYYFELMEMEWGSHLFRIKAIHRVPLLLDYIKIEGKKKKKPNRKRVTARIPLPSFPPNDLYSRLWTRWFPQHICFLGLIFQFDNEEIWALEGLRNLLNYYNYKPLNHDSIQAHGAQLLWWQSGITCGK